MSGPTAVTQTTEIVENFVIDSNPLITPYNNESITKLVPLPRSSLITSHNSKGTYDNPLFTFEASPKTYIDMGMILQVRIPVKISLAADADAVITEANYLDKFNNFENICFRQFGLARAIQSIQVTLNGYNYPQINDVGKNLAIVSQYWNEEDLNERFDASTPDKYANYDTYSSSAKSYDALDDVNVKMKMIKSVFETADIFKGSSNSSNNTRKMQFTWASPAADSTYNNRRDVCGYVSFATPIPFNINTLPGANESLYGIEKYQMNVHFESEFVRKLFSVCKQNTGTAVAPVYSDIINDIDYWSYGSGSNSLIVRELTSTQAVNNSMVDARGVVKPYRVGFNKPSSQPYNKQTLVAGVPTQFTTGQISCSTVPSDFYIAVKETRGSKKWMNLADNYARITQLTVGTGTTDMTLPNGRALYELCKANGLNRDVETAMRGSGFAVRIKASDLAWAEDTFVGQSKNLHFTFKCTAVTLEPGEYELIVMTSEQASLLFQEGRFDIKTGTIIDPNVLTDENFRHPDGGYQERMTVIGGINWGALGSLASKGYRYLSNNHGDIKNFVQDQWKKMKAAGPVYNVTGGSGVKTLGAGKVKSFNFK